jgi:hypothetical protein
MAKRIPVLSEEADYGLDRSLAGSLGLRGPAEYEGELLDRTVDWISERPDIDS